VKKILGTKKIKKRRSRNTKKRYFFAIFLKEMLSAVSFCENMRAAKNFTIENLKRIF
jgi:hypothetical protein